jgi:hypothetical protein
MKKEIDDFSASPLCNILTRSLATAELQELFEQVDNLLTNMINKLI